ncbi:type II toxin-antitoxin system Phd/YefM family antitoxin [Dehalococcoidia bacterium]|nr:type II toxin-antitoxin system Phd/YefM family antitoxin [Dehalococcoidia bacterium]
MKTIFAEQLGQEVRRALDDLAGKGEEPILLNSKGQRFVILKEEDYRGWIETAHLLSSPKNSQVLQEALTEPLDRCRDVKDILDELGS